MSSSSSSSPSAFALAGTSRRSVEGQENVRMLPQVKEDEFHVPWFKLNTGSYIPAIGLGTVMDVSHSPSLIHSAVLQAIKLGYRHIDTASFYKTESVIGEALAEAFRTGLVKRADMFITSKLWCDDHDPQDVLPALQKSLRLLQLQYLDLYLMHFPVKLKKGSQFPPKEDQLLPVHIGSTWTALEKCMRMQLTKAIGVSNFSTKKLADLLSYAQIPPAVNQVEMHPVWQQTSLKAFCDANSIHVSAWSPLAAPGAHYGTTEVLNHPIIKTIAQKHGKTAAQIALRWGIQRGMSVLPRSYNNNRLAENFDILKWELTPQDLAEIRELKQKRTTPCAFFCSKNYGSYKGLWELWDEEI